MLYQLGAFLGIRRMALDRLVGLVLGSLSVNLHSRFLVNK